ncbi:MAG: class I SAM-dependent methyltransferase, partial [bacterium]|nr:class I SAM-dependent methyltransferase [bacterium]
MYKLSTFPLKNIICLLLTLTILTLAGTMGYTDEKEPDDLPVPFEPTHPKVVATMLELAKIQKDDIIIDPGCGDGRILIKAALKYGAKSVCMDISPQRISEAREKAVDYGVGDKIKFIVGDSLKQDFSEASVIMLYMLEDFNVQLRPIFFKQLKPGTRVVAHGFHMGDWEPDQEIYHKKA